MLFCNRHTMQHAQRQWAQRVHRRVVTPRLVTCHAASQAPATAKSRVVFLGTPDVAALVLNELVAASRQPDATFEVVGVVSQPGKPRGRGNKSKPVPTPVEEAATNLGLQPQLMSPATARDPAFLDALTALQPDLCITAAYGNMLPQRFLDIPRLGTLNIHPSLLPKYRGAAPVQRCLQSGDTVGGVSVAYTVLACDAGPVLAQKQVPLDPNIQAPELLSNLFRQGVQLLLEHLPTVFAGEGMQRATPQDASTVTHAAKLSKEDALLDLSKPALELHNTVRGLAGWPGTVAKLSVEDEATGAVETIELRVVRSVHPRPEDVAVCQSQQQGAGAPQVAWSTDGSNDMLLPCGTPPGSSVLRVTTVQPPTKKAMAARDFKNGLRKKRLLLPVAAAAVVA